MDAFGATVLGTPDNDFENHLFRDNAAELSYPADGGRIRR